MASTINKSKEAKSDLQKYNIPDEQLASVEDLFAAALAEAGYPATVNPGEGTAASPCPDDVWVRACNIIRFSLGIEQFPDVETWRRWNRRNCY